MAALLPALALTFILTGCLTDNATRSDPVERSLVVMGDLQIGNANWQPIPQANPSGTNIPQLRQNVADIAALPSKPDHTFILGDLVVGELEDQGRALEVQLNAWMTLFRGFHGGAAINLVPLPGNHEMDYSDKAVDDEAPYPYSYSVWNSWIASNRLFPFEANGPRPGGANPDQLVEDESRYTHSFNWGAVHIVIINTDTLSTATNPATGLPYSGWIPIHWLAADLAAAQADPAISAILLMGHRPIEVPDFVPPPAYGHTILNLNQHQLAGDLAALLQRTPKVKAYFCSHVHAFNAARLVAAPRIWQIVSGNGGAPLEKEWAPKLGTTFGFAEIRLHSSGRLSVANYGRDPPSGTQPFYEATPVPPAPAAQREVIELD